MRPISCVLFLKCFFFSLLIVFCRQFGIFDVPDLDNPDDDDSGGDSDFEAELAAITAGEKNEEKKSKPKPKVIPQADLDKLVAESLRDIG